MNFSGDLGVKISSTLTIIIPIAIAVSMMIFVKILKERREKSRLNTKYYKKKFGTLTEGLNTKTAIGTYWNVLILLRWLWTTAVLICVRDHNEIQILSLFLTSVLFQCLILVGQPMPSPIENWFSVFNEVMVSLYLYTLLDLTDYFGDNNHRDESGYVLVGIIFVSVAANFTKFFALVLREIRLLILKRCKKVKADNQDDKAIP